MCQPMPASPSNLCARGAADRVTRSRTKIKSLADGRAKRDHAGTWAPPGKLPRIEGLGESAPFANLVSLEDFKTLLPWLSGQSYSMRVHEILTVVRRMCPGWIAHIKTASTTAPRACGASVNQGSCMPLLCPTMHERRREDKYSDTFGRSS